MSHRIDVTLDCITRVHHASLQVACAHWLRRRGGRGFTRNEIWHKGSLGDEDDARTSNTRIAQRKRAIPHSAIKTHRNMRRLL